LNLKDYPRKEYNIQQLTQPPCFDLQGERFYFVMDDGYDYELNILDHEYLEWSREGSAPKREFYRCLKSDDTTYILHYEVKGAELRTGHTYVIDREQRLVTMLRCKLGENPKFPMIVSSHFDFGAIQVEGEYLPFKRHCFSNEIMGTTVQWHWRSNFFTQHYYYTSDHYRITVPSRISTAMEYGGATSKKPGSDEWARYVKIKENMFLFVLVEAYSERLVGAAGNFRSNNMAFLQNYDRMYHVGRSFGTGMKPDGSSFPINMLFGAFGQPVDLDPAFLSYPNPFTV